jgi:MFS family permease
MVGEMASPDDAPAGRRDEPSSATAPRFGRTGRAIRRIAIDVTPLRRSRDFRLLWLGLLMGTTGRQVTAVALPYQVFVQTGSSLAVGLIGLAQAAALIGCSLVAGPLADRIDRRRLIIVSEVGMGLTAAALAALAAAGTPPIWLLYVLAGVDAGLSGVSGPARSAAVPSLVGNDNLPAAMALSQTVWNGTSIVGPALAGVVLAGFGVPWAYGLDALLTAGAVGAALLVGPLRPLRDPNAPATTGWQAFREGMSFLRRRRVLLGTFAIDLNAMIFGMPRALFPVLALTKFDVGPQGLGLLYAAPAVGALLGAVTAGWVGRVRKQGKAVVWAVVAWGAAIAAFGLASRFWLALVLLALAGAADVISAVFRGTMLQVATPDALRGRISAVNIMVVASGPRLGDVEAGVVAAAFTPTISVISGGLACIAGAFLVAALIPELPRYRAPRTTNGLDVAGTAELEVGAAPATEMPRPAEPERPG